MLVGIGHRRQSEELVDLMLECHERIRRFSNLALELGRRADVVSEEVVDGCHRCERYFTEALPLHVEDEEKSLLPRLVGRRPEVDEALALTQRQHAEHEGQLAALLGALRAVRAEPDAAPQRVALHRVADRLVRSFEEHLKVEEQIIFPAVRVLVPREAQLAVIQELRARRRPSDP